MVAKPFSFLIILAILIPAISPASAANSFSAFWPEPRNLDSLQIYKVTLTADRNGTISYSSPGVYGFLSAIGYNTNSASKGTVTINTTIPYSRTVDTYALSGGNTIKNLRQTTTMYMTILSGPLTFDASSGAVTDANKTIEVWFYMER